LTPILVEITYRRRLLEVILDLVLITVAYYTAYLLRFEGVLGPNFDFFLKSLPLMIACQILCFYALGVYQGVWESAGVRDLTGYIKAVTAGTVLPILILLGLYRFISFSRAVFAIYWGLMLILVSLSRLSFRLLRESVRKVNQDGKAALIYGAGIGGQMLVREIETDQRLGLRLVGFVDDNFRVHGRKIKGYPILGGRQDLPQVIQKYGIEEIIVSFKERGGEKKKEIENMCLENGIAVAVKQMRLLIS
jgi:UDP-GlcNAc:undecaprenyl-phosphate GlcNAc-1-phosphate transferase